MVNGQICFTNESRSLDVLKLIVILIMYTIFLKADTWFVVFLHIYRLYMTHTIFLNNLTQTVCSNLGRDVEICVEYSQYFGQVDLFFPGCHPDIYFPKNNSVKK